MEPNLHPSDPHRPSPHASRRDVSHDLRAAVLHEEDRKRALYESGIVDEW